MKIQLNKSHFAGKSIIFVCVNILIFFIHFISDVEALSARLMHNIVDVRHIENGGGGRIVLHQEADGKDRIFNPHEVRCVYLEQLLGKKYTF